MFIRNRGRRPDLATSRSHRKRALDVVNSELIGHVIIEEKRPRMGATTSSYGADSAARLEAIVIFLL